MRHISILCFLGGASALFLSALLHTSTAHAETDTEAVSISTSNPYLSPATSVDGVVAESRSFWRNKRIVTESRIRPDDKAADDVLVTQPGGTVDGIGMIQFPGLPVLAQGDRVSLTIAASTARAKVGITRAHRILDVIALERSAEPRGGSASTELKFVRTTNDDLAPLYWSSGCIHIKYDAAGTSHLPGDMEFLIMDGVFDTWRADTQACSYLTFSLEGSDDDLEVGADNQNVVKFRDDTWCRPDEESGEDVCYNPSAAALTTLHFINSADSDRNGEILDADIEFNGANFAISADGMSESQGCLSDLAATMTHEVGHLMGLDHTCVATAPLTTQGQPKPWPVTNSGEDVPSCNGDLAPELTEATMYNFQDCGETMKATPEADDINAVCTVYALDNDPNECKRAQFPTGKRVCACTVGGGDKGNPLAAIGPFLLFGFIMLRRRRTA